MSQNLELQKIRDFGELITDTFIFIRQNFKPLIKCFFIFCGFFLLAGAILSAIQQGKAVNTINDAFSTIQTGSRLNQTNPFAFFGVEYFLSILFILLNYIAIQVTVYSYMCLYKVKGNEPPTIEEVWGYFKFFYLKILGSGILLFILLMVGFLLCVIPGIYLYPVLALVFPIMIFENTSLRYAFNRSFRLIKDNWWLTFGTLFVVGLIVYFAAMALVLPAALLNFSSFFLHPRGGLHISTTTTIITSILSHLSQLFYILPLVTLSLCYFSLAEKLDGTGLIERISQIGNIRLDNNSHPEEY
ncbi:MAG TPA: hypothetical protein VIM16_09310 [Mucilaginibacter sp.]|jgi:uncharacterized membrane protein